MTDLDELLDGVDALTSGYQGWECDGSASICDQRLDALESLADALVSVCAERDAAVAAIERVRAAAKDWECDEDAKGLHFDLVAALDGAPEPEEKP